MRLLLCRNCCGSRNNDDQRLSTTYLLRFSSFHVPCFLISASSPSIFMPKLVNASTMEGVGEVGRSAQEGHPASAHRCLVGVLAARAHETNAAMLKTAHPKRNSISQTEYGTFGSSDCTEFVLLMTMRTVITPSAIRPGAAAGLIQKPQYAIITKMQARMSRRLLRADLRLSVMQAFAYEYEPAG